MHVCRFPHADRALTPELRAALEETLFEFFVAEEEPPAESGVPGPGNVSAGQGAPAGPSPRLAELVADIARGCTYRSYTAGVPPLAEKVAHEAVTWCDQKWAELSEDDPFAAQEAELAAFRAADGAGPDDLQRRIRTLWSRYPENVVIWRTYDRAAGQLTEATPRERGVRGAALSARVAAAWSRILRERRARFERAFLKQALPPFIERLNREVPLMARARERVRDFLGESAGVWDLLEGEWQSVMWQGLEEAAAALEAEPSVGRLARLLGRSRHVPQEYTDEEYEEVTETRSVETEALGRSEIEGVSFSSDVETLIPAERALLADADTELVFSKRFADNELLSFDYRSAREVEHVDRTVRVRTRRRPLERGPIIACIDTSGSMTGKPEQVAKALTLALARVASGGGRPCYLISFSTDIRTYELADAATLPELTEFLAFSFHGGTDLRPALEESLRVLETRRYRRADVLVVSDFRVPKLLERHTRRIASVQSELGTLFHSVTVSPGPPVDPMHIFDFHWHYDTTVREGGIVALEQGVDLDDG